MRTFIIILCIVAASIAAIFAYLVLTTPKDAAELRFPLTHDQEQLLALVPADAEAWALVPSPVVLMRKLLENPVTRDPIAEWQQEQSLPPPMILGRAETVIWKSGKTTSYAVRFDPIRAALARLWTMVTSADVRWQGRTLIINGGAAGGPAAGPSSAAEAATAPLATVSVGLPAGDVLIVQQRSSRGAFPPIGRPAITTLRVTGGQIDITSRAPSGRAAAGAPVVQSLPRSAILSAAFTDPPRVLGDLDRLLGADVDALAGGGGAIAIYRVESGRLLPRPHLAIAVPANGATRAAAGRYAGAIEAVGEVVENGGQLVVAFDRTSARQYVSEARTPMPWPADRWSLRLDPGRLVPILRDLGDNPALRFVTPRLHRGARDLRGWIGALERAGTVEAASSSGPGFEELRVRIVSPAASNRRHPGAQK